jgi:hypothetical protein
MPSPNAIQATLAKVAASQTESEKRDQKTQADTSDGTPRFTLGFTTFSIFVLVC